MGTFLYMYIRLYHNHVVILFEAMGVKRTHHDGPTRREGTHVITILCHHIGFESLGEEVVFPMSPSLAASICQEAAVPSV